MEIFPYIFSVVLTALVMRWNGPIRRTSGPKTTSPGDSVSVILLPMLSGQVQGAPLRL